MNGVPVRFVIVASAAAMTCLAWAAAGAEDFEISRSTIDGGGIMFSTGGDFELSGTIGQPDAAAMSGGEFELSGGFWFPLAEGDCNSDGGVDLVDFGDIDVCLSGPGGGVTLDCRCFDLDRDDDVDLTEVAAFQRSFTGK